MHAREVGRGRERERNIQSLTCSSKRERFMAEPNELGFVMEWVVEEREGTGHAVM